MNSQNQARTGLRSSELETLDWNEINLHRKIIEVKAEKAKTSWRRFVEMSDNLCAGLKPYEKMEGPIVSIGSRDRLQRLSWAPVTRAQFNALLANQPPPRRGNNTRNKNGNFCCISMVYASCFL
jgi:integrase